VLESLPQVAAYVKNDYPGFVIPYTLEGEQRSYLPDFLVRARVANGDTPLTLIVEVSGATHRTRPRRSVRRGTCGCRPSTHSAASGAGASSRSRIPTIAGRTC
jgi:hypothetical protein